MRQWSRLSRYLSGTGFVKWLVQISLISSKKKCVFAFESAHVVRFPFTVRPARNDCLIPFYFCRSRNASCTIDRKFNTQLASFLPAKREAKRRASAFIYEEVEDYFARQLLVLCSLLEISRVCRVSPLSSPKVFSISNIFEWNISRVIATWQLRQNYTFGVHTFIFHGVYLNFVKKFKATAALSRTKSRVIKCNAQNLWSTITIFACEWYPPFIVSLSSQCGVNGLG